MNVAVQLEILATFSDGPGGIRKSSAVERAIKKQPNLPPAVTLRLWRLG
jgi:hypothetical protein